MAEKKVKQEKMERRQFLKGVGGVMAATAAVSAAEVVKPAKVVAENIVNPVNSKGRYPWWVKEVEQITTETNWEEFDKKPYSFKNNFGMGNGGALYNQIRGKGAIQKLVGDARANMPDLAHSGTPGETIPDMALNNAARSVYWWNSNDKEFLGDSVYYRMREKSNMYYDIQSDPRMGKWEASPEEVTAKLRQAARLFGAQQIGIAPFDEEMKKMTYIDWSPTPGAPTEIDWSIDWKHVITIVLADSDEGRKRVGTSIGDATNRLIRGLGSQCYWMMMTFVEQLGYNAQRWSGNQPYAAIRSGIGELGRHNRVVSPIFGGSMVLFQIITDIPLVNDNPIDFGLQEFCKGCKKCAEVCPAKAISFAEEPSWDYPKEQTWHQPGKKAYYENSIKCFEYLMSKQQMCGLCLVACPWSKQDKTALHEIVKVFSAKTPGLSKIIKSADDSFGYGNYFTDGKLDKIEEWWDMDLPVYDIDSDHYVK